MHSDITAEDFISQLVSDGLSSVPWLGSRFPKDFILLAEFSELEGPKPIFTIPEDLKMKFNLEMFAVRIMSVDCVSIMQTTDLSSFNIAGDIQVVLTEVSEGAVAYVHHFVLYDIRARGYVRPYCLAYVTQNHARLMKIYESLVQYFSLLSTLFHFGNALSFIHDLVMRWEQLSHLKECLADKFSNIFVEEKMLAESQKKAITDNDDVDVGILQMKIIHKTFIEYLRRDKFNEHRQLYHLRYGETIKKTMEPEIHSGCRQSLSSEEGGGMTYRSCNAFSEIEDSGITIPSASHDIPSDVIYSIIGKKYDKPLRHLKELCDVTFDSGLDILKFILENHVGGNTQRTIQFKLPDFISRTLGRNFDSFEQNHPFPLEDCSSMYTSKSNSISVKQFLINSRDQQEIKINIETPDSGFITGTDKTNTALDIHNSFLTGLTTITSVERSILPNNSTSNSFVASSVSPPSASVVTGNRNECAIGSPNSSIDNPSYSSSDSFKEIMITTSSGTSRTSTSDSLAESSYDQISLSQPVVTSIIKENGIFKKHNLKPHKVSLLAMRKTYSFIAHAVYSILIGRPVVIIGEQKNKKKVAKLVSALANFITDKEKSKMVIPWLNESLSLNHLGLIPVIGLLKNTKGNTVQNSLKPYVSILDYEEETLLAPRYVGKFLSDMFNVNTKFSTDASYRQYILQLFTELSSQVFIRFIVVYAYSGKYNITSNYGDANSNVNRTVRGDEAIIAESIHNTKVEILRTFSGSFSEDLDTIIRKPRRTMKLNTMGCDLFSNSSKRKK